MKKQFGSIYWRLDTAEPTLYLQFTIPGRPRIREPFAVARLGTEKEKALIEQHAIARLEELRVQVEKNEDPLFENPYPTYIQMANFWWDKYQSLKPYMAERYGTSDWKRVQITIDYLGPYHADQIDGLLLKKFRGHLRTLGDRAPRRQWSNNYINKFITIVGQVYHYCQDQEQWTVDNAPPEELIKYGNIDIVAKIANPSHGFPSLPETPYNPIVPTIEQFRALWNILPKNLQEIALLGIHTGLRPWNLRHLTWDQIHIENHEIEIRRHKGSKECCELLCLHPEALEMLRRKMRERAANDDHCLYVWHSDSGRPWRNLYNTWRDRCETAGLKGFQVKHLRTTYCSWRVEEGVEALMLQRAMLHTTVQTTSRHYNHARNATREIVKNQRSVLAS